MNDRVAVAGLFAQQPDGRCSGVQTDRNEPDRFRGNLQQKSPKFLRSLAALARGLLERRPDRPAGRWSGAQTDQRPVVHLLLCAQVLHLPAG
jgi:hypothetical protein